jgi:hypothetical protein
VCVSVPEETSISTDQGHAQAQRREIAVASSHSNNEAQVPEDRPGPPSSIAAMTPRHGLGEPLLVAGVKTGAASRWDQTKLPPSSLSLRLCFPIPFPGLEPIESLW